MMGLPRLWPALFLASCAPHGPLKLQTLDPPDMAWGSLDIEANASIMRSTSGSLDLEVDLRINHTGKHPARLDLASARLQVDGLAWERCQTAFDFDSDQLLIVLAAEETTSLSLHCLEVQRPVHSLTLRFVGSGMGTEGPTIDIPFSGLRNR